MWQKIKAGIARAWKAVVALAIPILFGAAAELVDGFSQWIGDQGYVWSGLVVGALTSLGVWLKANRA